MSNLGNFGTPNQGHKDSLSAFAGSELHLEGIHLKATVVLPPNSSSGPFIPGIFRLGGGQLSLSNVLVSVPCDTLNAYLSSKALLSQLDVDTVSSLRGASGTSLGSS